MHHKTISQNYPERDSKVGISSAPKPRGSEIANDPILSPYGGVCNFRSAGIFAQLEMPTFETRLVYHLKPSKNSIFCKMLGVHQLFILFMMLTIFTTPNLFAADAPPPSKKKTICLNMIVKNEAPVIERCLKSVLPLIDTWVIVDTGSTDGTQKIIKNFLKGIPGELYERPWVNFGHNREEALQLAKKKADYVLFMDADDVLAINENFVLPDLTHDFYGIMARAKGFEWMLPQLLKSSIDWHWYGVIHEYVTSQEDTHGVTLANVEYVYINDGARSKDQDRYLRDIQLLLDGLKAEPENYRYLMYLGITYTLAKDYPNALKYYEKSVNSKKGGLVEERYYARLGVAKSQHEMHMDPQIIKASYAEAFKFYPKRIEGIYALIKLWREEGDYQRAFNAASLALNVPRQGALFVEHWIHDYGLLFEYALNAYYTDHFSECRSACELLLKMENIDELFRKDTKLLYDHVLQVTPASIEQKLIQLID